MDTAVFEKFQVQTNFIDFLYQYASRFFRGPNFFISAPAIVSIPFLLMEPIFSGVTVMKKVSFPIIQIKELAKLKAGVYTSFL
ncbi:MAG: hypothetical protein IJF41_07310 [Clostridia bacterium]|nr:hypothetical protein [Clostridia bacterium]